ncbi:MAG: hypothetical protein JSS00_03545 [Proteobacteria bacterium]|nr:hypothetical protein [Pseudomonadota bacterium]
MGAEMGPFSAFVFAHLADFLTFSGILFAVISFVAQSRRALAVQKIDLYQGLETSSIELFKFEAEHARVLEKFQDIEIDERKFADATDPDGGKTAENFGALQARFGSMKEFAKRDFRRVESDRAELQDDRTRRQFEEYERQRLITRKFYEQTLNLFEMATRFRNKRIIEPEVFGSWVIWFYDTLVQWGFRDHWPELRQNYTPDLRAVFNGFVSEFNPEEDIDERKHRFFGHVANLTHCQVIRNWLRKLDEEKRQFHFDEPRV